MTSDTHLYLSPAQFKTIYYYNAVSGSYGPDSDGTEYKKARSLNAAILQGKKILKSDYWDVVRVVDEKYRAVGVVEKIGRETVYTPWRSRYYYRINADGSHNVKLGMW